MELRQLKTFLVIAKMGSFIQAAETLGYAQSTITNHIQMLENEVGVRLFERLGHRVLLTHQGNALFPYAEQIIKLTSQAFEVVANPDMPQGKLTIGTSESLGTYCLPKLFQNFRMAYPKVEMVLKFANHSTICSGIRKNEIDVGLVINERQMDNDLVAEVLSEEQMLFLTAPDNQALKGTVMPRELAEKCVILTEPGCGYRLTMEKFLKDFGVSPQSFLEASSTEAIKQLILLGLGISILPRFTVEKELAEGRICTVPWKEADFQYHVQMLYHKDKWISPTLQAFFDMIRDFYVNKNGSDLIGQGENKV